jgi:hypothetical protein
MECVKSYSLNFFWKKILLSKNDSEIIMGLFLPFMIGEQSTMMGPSCNASCCSVELLVMNRSIGYID